MDNFIILSSTSSPDQNDQTTRNTQLPHMLSKLTALLRYCIQFEIMLGKIKKSQGKKLQSKRVNGRGKRYPQYRLLKPTGMWIQGSIYSQPRYRKWSDCQSYVRPSLPWENPGTHFTRNCVESRNNLDTKDLRKPALLPTGIAPGPSKASSQEPSSLSYQVQTG